MRSHVRRRAGHFGAATLAWIVVALPAAAQDDGADAGAALVDSSAQPPQLLETVDSGYPEQARAERREGTVVLRLTIDATGRVTDVEVTQPAGFGFDEAAREAVARFRFQPAERGGVPVASRILFPYEFRLPQEPPPLPPPPPPPPPPAAKAAREPLEVQVTGAQSEARRLRESAEAVQVIDTGRAQQQTADLGEVLARTQGVVVRRTGGLGSTARFSLNGLYDDQIRFFLDGIPLDVAGFPFKLFEVPPNLIERVEIYRGVVPIRFGADALGGAVNLVGDQNYETHAGASYQVGSFNTHRVTLDARYRHEPTGFVASAVGFLDSSDNDYEVDVGVPDDRGRLQDVTVPRFHDGYRALGATVEAGFVDQPWAKRLLLRGFLSGYDKDLQTSAVMTRPYGEATYGETVYGTTARYDIELSRRVSLELVANYAHRIIEFFDRSRWVYDWTGERVNRQSTPGETGDRPLDQTVWQDSAFGRALVTVSLAPEHVLRASLTPSFATRSGDEKLMDDPRARDPLTAQRDLFTFVSGVEYELSLFDDRFSNIVFVKDYYYDAKTEEPIAGSGYRRRDLDRHRLGVGDSLRLRITPWLLAKASYEYATRLPRPDELFGDAVLVRANLELEPEVSHNLNLGPRLEFAQEGFGALTLEVNGFVRASDRLIVLIGSDSFAIYGNVYEALSVGLENAFGWESPGQYVVLDGTLTWQDVRNTSDEGTFGRFEGDRIPNRPYLFGSWGVRFRVGSMPSAADSLEPFYLGRYVHGFARGWETRGLQEYKQTVDAQVAHSAGITWTFARDWGRFYATFEVDNLTNARVFDNFGAQRPGRAFYLKLAGEL